MSIANERRVGIPVVISTWSKRMGVVVCLVAGVATGLAQPCIVPDDGSGTVVLPPAGCAYLSPDEVHMIIDGLPPGTTIELEPIHQDFICNEFSASACSLPLPGVDCEGHGGSLGGNFDCFESSLQLEVQGTGALAGFTRSLSVPIFCEVHTGPRNPGDPVQTFANEMMRLQGELLGDPDFCQFKVTAGTDFGLPSPGQTVLTQLPGGDFAVDSFFDITYQIEFEGCPGSILDGYAGVTTATIHMQTGGGDCGPRPDGAGCLPVVCPGSAFVACEPYVLDDGTLEDWVGLSDPGYIAWMNQFEIQDGAETINNICIAFGDAPDGAAVTVYLWSDPDGDGKPHDARVLAMADSAVQYPTTGIFVTVDIPATYVGPGGTSFFAGAIIQHDVDEYPAGIDLTDPVAHRSWIAGDLALVDPNNLAGAMIPPSPIDDLWQPGDWMIRAGAIGGGGSEQCLAVCVKYDPLTGARQVMECECRGQDECHVELISPDGGARQGPCVVPDDGSGTVVLPPAGCEYLSPDEVHLIIDGLPAGTTIELAPIHKDFICYEFTGPCSIPLAPGECEAPGGTLGGNGDCFESQLHLQVNGTGALAGYTRTLSVPIFCEVHTSPRNPGDPVQTFDNEMYRLQGELFGDPDFCVFKVVGGSDYGLPGPGQTTLTQLPGGDFAVDSFFDITYRIEFQGCPGSPLDGFAGATTATIHMQTPPRDKPHCVGACPPGYHCEESVFENDDGTLDICCNCVQDVTECMPLPDGSGCYSVACPGLDDACMPHCAIFDHATGRTQVTDCDCRPPSVCHLEIVDGVASRQSPCVVPDDGSGTIVLPPAGCAYLSPQEVHMIIDGLPPGTTIELDPIHQDFICNEFSVSACSLPLGFDRCEDHGGSLGGNFDCFESWLYLDVHGTGSLAGFTRTLAVPIFCEVHTGPRNPGEPVQTFANEMFRLQGELLGDPDFCTFKVMAGADYGLPSPGQTTLTDLMDGNFAVDSFFDITYQIDFEGCPGSILDGYAGVTTATIHMETPRHEPPICVGECPPGYVCHRTETEIGDGLIEICCDCVRALCPGDLNCDGVVNYADIDPFVAALSCVGGDPSCWPPAGIPADCPWLNGDCNGDGKVTYADIDPFVARIGATCP